MALKFVSLHNHTGASVYDGLGSPKDLAEWMLKNAGEDSGAFAITNHGNMNDIGYQVATQREYDKKGTPVKMIYGVEAYYLPDIAEWRALKDAEDEEKKAEKKKKKSDESNLVIEDEEESKSKKFLDPINRRNHLVVCATNQRGLQNLFRLVSRSYRQGFYRKPRIDLKILKDCNEGLMVSTACIAGIPAYCTFLSNETSEPVMDLYEKELGPLMEIFGKDRFFLELQFNRIEEQQYVNLDLMHFAEKTGYKLIATADCHYPQPEMWRDRELYKLLGWQMKKQDTDEKIETLRNTKLKDLDCELYLKSGDQMFEAYKDKFRDYFPQGSLEDVDKVIRESIERTYDIAHNMIEKIYPDDSTKLPKSFQVTEKIKTPFDKLKMLCLTALKEKNLNKKEYIDRAIYELKVVRDLGVSEYFLAKKEILDVLRKHMLTGVGRGSGAGSLICYLLDITFLDPLRYDLLFERFMSTSRKEMPDIDTDIALKDEALDILKDHFGSENVLAISNYNRLQLKSLIKDLAKLYKIPFQESNALTTVMEKEAKDDIMKEVGYDQKLYEFTFEGAKKYSPTFQQFLKKYPEVGQHVENLFQEVKSIGRHAGGVLIAPDVEGALPIIKIRGVEQTPINEGITVKHLKYFGLEKFDVLGLATLRIITRCIETILKNQGVNKPTIQDVWSFYYKHLHPDVMNEADSKVFQKVYRNGNFPSIFQFAEKAVQKFCQKAQPNSVADVSAITALWRPGPLKGGADQTYLGALDRKNRQAFKKEHPIVQRILGDTRGVLLYQEQFMLLAHELAGFTLEEANRLRKLLVQPETSMAEELKRERIDVGNKFIKGCMDKGLTEDRARKLWEKEILGFISYGFNKSHSACYAFNSYHCAWLYTYYEKEWIKACLECDPNPQETLLAIRGLGYNVEKPDVNTSEVREWKISGTDCVPALTSLKGVGVTGAQELVKYRPSGGYKNLQEFFYDGNEWRYSKLNKKCLQALMRVEAFRSLGGAIGPGGVFKNHAHMEDALFGQTQMTSKVKKGALVTHENMNLLKSGRTTFAELALEANDADWPVSTKIEHQKEIVGFYDKSLIVGKFLNMFREFEIDAIDETEDEKNKKKVWATVDDVIQKKARNGNPFLVVKASGVTEKPYTFRVWKTSIDKTELWIPGNILIFSLHFDEDWGYNVPPGCKVMKVEK